MSCFRTRVMTYRRHLLIALLCLPAATGTGCVAADFGPEETGDYDSGLVVDNGESVNGRRLNGWRMNGPRLNGPRLNGWRLNGWRLNGADLRSISLTGSLIHGILDNGSTAPATSLVGRPLRAVLADGTPLDLQIDSITTSIHDSDVHLYSIRTSIGGGPWEPLCEGGVPAIPLSGTWDVSEGHPAGRDGAGDLGGGAWYPSDGITFACQGFALAKCAENGYKPWGPSQCAYNEDGTQTCGVGRPFVDRQNPTHYAIAAYRDLHQACVRMIRSDYCGDGTPHTRDGTPIDVRDIVGVQADDESLEWPFEASWNARGAVELSEARWESVGGESVEDYVNTNCREIANTLHPYGNVDPFWEPTGTDTPIWTGAILANQNGALPFWLLTSAEIVREGSLLRATVELRNNAGEVEPGITVGFNLFHANTYEGFDETLSPNEYRVVTDQNGLATMHFPFPSQPLGTYSVQITTLSTPYTRQYTWDGRNPTETLTLTPVSVVSNIDYRYSSTKRRLSITSTVVDIVGWHVWTGTALTVQVSRGGVVVGTFSATTNSVGQATVNLDSPLRGTYTARVLSLTPGMGYGPWDGVTPPNSFVY